MGAELTPRQQRMEAAGILLVKVGGSATPGELASALGLSNRHRQADVVGDLAAADCVTRGAGRVKLTPKGWARFAGIGQADAGEVLDRVLAGWPAPHRAFLELLVCALIARHHLAKAYPRHEHLGFMALGETSTGKSAMADLVCHLFGFDPVQTSVHTPGETAGSLLGRRAALPGGTTAFEPAPMTRRPFIFLDEFDKADLQVQARAWNYFRGTVATPAEGEVYQLLPTPMLAANPPPKGGRLGALRPEYRRRSVVLDTGSMAGRGRELAKHLRTFYADTTPADRLSLDGLVPPAALDKAALEVFEAGEQALTDAGRAEFPGDRALELATLGRLALLGPATSHQMAAVGTMAAYLTVTESVSGQVIDGWQQALADWAGQAAGGESVMASLERRNRDKAEALGQATSNRRRTQHAEQGVLQAGAELAERCRLARVDLDARKVSREHKPAAAGLRKALARHQDSAAKISTAVGLDDITAVSAPVLEQAGQLLALLNAERGQVETARLDSIHDRQRERAEGKQRAAWEARERRQYRAGRVALLKRVRTTAGRLERLDRRKATKPGESPLEVLAGERVDGHALLTYQPPVAEQRPKGFWAKVGYQQPRGRWVIAGTGYGYPGTPLSCPALAAWGQNTRAVIAPTLTFLHELEDGLVGELGSKPRQRASVSSSQTRAIAR